LAGTDVGDFDAVQGRLDEWLASPVAPVGTVSNEQAELRAALRLPRE